MKTYGYVRVSTREQNEARQFIAMEAFGVIPENIFLQKAFPDVKAVRDYIDHRAERTDDPTEGNAYLEMEHGLYCLRMIARNGDYNLYLHALSKAALKGGGLG